MRKKADLPMGRLVMFIILLIALILILVWYGSLRDKMGEIVSGFLK